MAVNFDAHGFIDGNGFGLMRRLLEHRREPEELAMRRFVDDNFLMLLVGGRYSYAAGHHNVRLATRVSDFVDALPLRETLHFNLAGEYGRLFFIEQREQWNMFQGFRIAGHKKNLRMENPA